MRRRLPLTLLLCAPTLACSFQQLDPSAAAGSGQSDAGPRTATQTPPIEIDFEGNVTTDSCALTSMQANRILEANCADCHSGREAGAHQGQPPFDFLFDFERLKSTTSSVADLRDGSRKMRFVSAGDPDNSRLYTRVARGEMPPLDVVGQKPRPRPTVSDISVLRQWITACMGGGSVPPPIASPPSAPPAAPPPAPPPGIDPPAPTPAPPPGPASRIVISSPDLREGGIMPAESSNPINRSPALSWTGAPAATRSFAVALTGVQSEIVLWVMWDIPASVLALPPNIARDTATPPEPMGSQQQNYQGTEGYIGPAANAQAGTRMYRFDVWALEVETLPVAGLGGGGGNQQRTTAIVERIKENAIRGAVGTLIVGGNPGD
jgi:phosphatidylethanolamine-binding protein (PEBP) family uncharacterized protein